MNRRPAVLAALFAAMLAATQAPPAFAAGQSPTDVEVTVGEMHLDVPTTVLGDGHGGHDDDDDDDDEGLLEGLVELLEEVVDLLGDIFD